MAANQGVASSSVCGCPAGEWSWAVVRCQFREWNHLRMRCGGVLHQQRRVDRGGGADSTQGLELINQIVRGMAGERAQETVPDQRPVNEITRPW